MIPGTTYSFIVEASNGTLSNNSDPVSLTYYTNPSMLGAVGITPLGSVLSFRNYRVSWQPPGSDGGSPIVSYQVLGYSRDSYDSGILSSTASIVDFTLSYNGYVIIVVIATNGAGYTYTNATGFE